MHFKPSRLEARAALNGDQYHELVARQRVPTTTEDPFGWLTSLFGGGDDTSTTTTRTRTTTTARPTVTDPTPNPVVVTTNTRTSTTPTTTPQTRPTASVVTTPPPQLIPSQQFTTVTSTASVNTGNTDASQANTNRTSNGGLPSVVIGIIVAASVIFGLIFVALIARKIFQSRRRNRRNTWATTGVTPFDAPVTEKALPPPPPTENQVYPSINFPAYPPTAVAGTTPYNPQAYSPAAAAASSPGYPAPYPFGTSGNAQLLMQQNYNNTTTAASFTAADLAGPVVIRHTPPTPTTPAAAVSVVKRTFVPSLPDELSISNGEQVRIISIYDDGWALCEKVSSGDKGVVPQECLEMVKQPSAGASATGSEESRLNRNSSLRHGPVQAQ